MNFNVSNCSNSLMFKCQRDSDPDFETKFRIRVLVQMRGWAPRGWRLGGWLVILSIPLGLSYWFSDLETILDSGLN